MEQNQNLNDIPRCFSSARFEDGHIMVCFDFNGHHLEAEIFEDGKVEAFYLNRNTRTTWEDETNILSLEEWKKRRKG